MPFRPRPDVRSLARLIEDAIDRPGCGPALVEVPAPSVAAAGTMVDVLRDRGFTPIRADQGAVDAAAITRVAHRHVAVIVSTPAERALATGWVKQLARVSPRAHLVVTLRSRQGERPAPAGGRRDPAARTTGTADPDPGRGDGVSPAPSPWPDDRRLARLMAAASLEPADAWLAALRVEAQLLGRPMRDDTLRLLVWLRLWQARYEEADAACRAIGCVPVRQALRSVINRLLCRHQGGGAVSTSSVVPGLAGRSRPAHGVTAMYLLPAVPSLLQLLTDSDDDLSALRAAASWALEFAGARGVAFVGADDGRLAAAVGWSGQTPPPGDRLLAARAGALECHDRGAATLVVAPVRQAGTHIGGVLVLGATERAGTTNEAATTLALLCAPALRTRLDQMSVRRHSRTLLPEIVGDSPAASAVRDAVARAAATPFAVLIEGESGTGKELVARALHRLSARRDRRFVAVNCAALSDELVEAELFGHTRGAFTGAVAPRTGLFEDAHGGTLFLDEVAELSPRAQAKLLRVLQEHEVRRVGENLPRVIDVRVIAATNRPLADACAAGQFRDDLRFRLAVIRLRLAPLRERAEDIAPLARTFWARATQEVGKRVTLGADALARLATHAWPGNVRELQNVIAGLALVAPPRGRVSARHVDLVLATSGAARHGPPMSLARARRACERQTVAAALARHAGRRSAAARELGLTRQGLAKIIRRLHLDDSVVEGVA